MVGIGLDGGYRPRWWVLPCAGVIEAAQEDQIIDACNAFAGCALIQPTIQLTDKNNKVMPILRKIPCK